MLLTKFAFVTTWMIKLLDFIMRVMAVRIITASFADFFTLHVIIGFEIRPSVVFLVVIKETRIFIMSIWIKKKNTLFFTLNRFKSHNIKSEELRKFKKTNLCFRIYCIFCVVNFITKLIGTVIKSFAVRSFKNQRMIVIFPEIMAIQAFLILTSTPYFLAILCIIQNLVKFSVRISPPVQRYVIKLWLIMKIVSQCLIILKIFLEMVTGTMLLGMSPLRTCQSFEEL